MCCRGELRSNYHQSKAGDSRAQSIVSLKQIGETGELCRVYHNTSCVRIRGYKKPSLLQSNTMWNNKFNTKQTKRFTRDGSIEGRVKRSSVYEDARLEASSGAVIVFTVFPSGAVGGGDGQESRVPREGDWKHSRNGRGGDKVEEVGRGEARRQKKKRRKKNR